ncbi:MAG: hypothetical protein ACR2M6_03115 [Vampirovibrionia bacterium]
MSMNRYSNPFIVQVLPHKNFERLPENPEKTVNAISKALYMNYFLKAASIVFKDYDFSECSIENYILSENAQAIYFNKYGKNVEQLSPETLTVIVDKTKEKLYNHRKVAIKHTS